MQTLRKKTSPCKYKNETSRFLGEGVSFKAKLIGILEVSEARGDRMCQEALSDLKMAIRAAGEHKQRITINIAIDGLRLRDEKTGDSLYHHPVHKISFIAQDMSDSRAFGYIFGSPDTGHRFFGIKTDKAASQVVIAMRDLFQVVFALKKKEIELAKQHLEHKTRYGSSSLFTDSSTKNGESHSAKVSTVTEAAKPSSTAEASSTAAVADLVDLELELNSLQQGLNQMERITPSDPFGPKDDPFGDSFTSYPQKPFLPPPPSAKDRPCRTLSSDTSSMFSPKTPKTAGSTDAIASDSLFNTSREEANSEDWFTPTATEGTLFEEPAMAPESTKESEPLSQQEILSQFDVFTELDPLGTGRSKPYVDKKMFFQELKNPPKKVLKDFLVGDNLQPADTSSVFAANFTETTHNVSSSATNATFQSDPFGDDPFVQTDPFTEADFSKDPFNTEFAVDFKQLNKDLKAPNENAKDFSDKFKFPPLDNLHPMFPTNLSRSPNKTAILEKTLSLSESSPRNTVFSKQTTFDLTNRYDSSDNNNKKAVGSKLYQLHENPSLDLSSESECAPEPPPRPPSNIQPIKPPPLPPKKQFGDLAAKPPPPRPPHDDSHYDYIYDTGPKSIETLDNTESGPPLPVPARKSRFETDFVPVRPKKQHYPPSSVEDDYLTPNAPPLLPPQQHHQRKEQPHFFKAGTNLLLPPPQKKDGKKSPTPQTVAPPPPSLNLETLDITLSQLTLSGLNDLAHKLNIPSSQLSNMTLAQLTSYISNHLRTQNEYGNDANANFQTFQADFDANFSETNETAATQDTYDKYAVFRELIEEEVKQTQIETVERFDEEEEDEEEEDVEAKQPDVETEPQQTSVESNEADRYAALRDIIVEENDVDVPEEEEEEDEEAEQQQNDLNQQSNVNVELDVAVEKDSNIMEYDVVVACDNDKEVNDKKSPVAKQPSTLVKSPVPIAITEIIQTNNHLTSGSLSDVVSGSSPEIDNTGSASEVVTTKQTVEKTSESWAIFDTPNIVPDVKEKQVQSEEGVSPWSSDSKEFGNGSPPEWRQRIDSESGGDNCVRRREAEHGWCDAAVEPPGYQHYPQNRRSVDSYDDDCYDQCYERPRRRRQPAWSGQTAAGGHSSSSRDVSPWEEEPRNRREPWMRRRPPSYDRHRRHDSWDEEDDFEYEEEHMGRFHWHDNREFDRGSAREMERHGGGERWDPEWGDERRPRRRPRGPDDHWCCPDWEHEPEGETPSARYSSGRWSNPDAAKWRDTRKRDAYYARDPHDSPWEDDQEEPQSPRYLTAKRNWKRPSSASEMDRKSGEIKSRQQGPYYVNAGGSDGERDRRYKAGRRSKSRDSQFAEIRDHQRHKPDPGLTLRYPHRTKPYVQKSGFENDFNLQDVPVKVKGDVKLQQQQQQDSTMKKTVMANRKKSKEITRIENDGSLPRRMPSRMQQSITGCDFVPSEAESPMSARNNSRFSFENDFETSEAESPTVGTHPTKGKLADELHHHQPKRTFFESDFKETRRQKTILKTNTLLDKECNKSAVHYHHHGTVKQKSLFEDDFSPTEKEDEYGISSIREEPGADTNESNDLFSVNNFDRTTNLSRKQKRLISKNRNSLRSGEVNIKKSESVNIFARENDPFDDDFFSNQDVAELQSIDNAKTSPRNPEFKWTEDFESFDNGRRK